MNEFPLNYVMIDIETSGLHAKDGDQILWIAALKISNKCVVDEFFSFVKSTINLPKLVTEITGVTNNMLCNAPPLSKVKLKLKIFISDEILVSHNSAFVDSFLVGNKDDEIFNSKVNILNIARRIYPKKSCTAENLLKTFELQPIKNMYFSDQVYRYHQIYEAMRARLS